MLIAFGNLPCHRVQLPVYINEETHFEGVFNVTEPT